MYQTSGCFFVIFFRYYRFIFRDGTQDTKRGKFQVTGCLNVIRMYRFSFDNPSIMSCHFYTNETIDMRSFLLFSWHRVILFDMRYMIIRSIVIEIASFMSEVKCHQYVIILWLLTFLTQDTWSMLIGITNIKYKCIQ